MSVIMDNSGKYPYPQISKPPKIGDRLVIKLFHLGLWRPLLWVRTGKDGSVFFGVLVGKVSRAKKFFKKMSGSTITIKDKDARPVSPPKSSRVTFHPDGTINFGDEKLKGGAILESLSKPTQLCIFRIGHPSRYKPQEKISPGDYEVFVKNYEVDDDYPLYGCLYIIPWSKNSPPTVLADIAKRQKMTKFQTMYFSFRGFRCTPDYTLQILIGHGLKGGWPVDPGIGVFPKSTI